MQVIPTGPTLPPEVAKEIVISALYAARRQLILTTPYYVPDPSLQMAMVAAARRGVDVTLIVPRKLDSRLVALASDPYQEDLIAAGVARDAVPTWLPAHEIYYGRRPHQLLRLVESGLAQFSPQLRNHACHLQPGLHAAAAAAAAIVHLRIAGKTSQWTIVHPATTVGEFGPLTGPIACKPSKITLGHKGTSRFQV